MGHADMSHNTDTARHWAPDAWLCRIHCLMHYINMTWVSEDVLLGHRIGKGLQLTSGYVGAPTPAALAHVHDGINQELGQVRMRLAGNEVRQVIVSDP